MNKEIPEALLPLPNELRARAEIFRYDSKWNRNVVRPGENGIHCHASDSVSLPSGLRAQCFHESWEPSMVRISQLLANGMAMAEGFNTMIAEIHAGKVEAPNPGAVLYELFDQPGLQGHANMAVATPNATMKSIGLSTEPNAYRPWLMMANTPMAHVMIQGK